MNGSVCARGPGSGSQVWEKEEDVPLGPGFALVAFLSWPGAGLVLLLWPSDAPLVGVRVEGGHLEACCLALLTFIL